MQKSMLTFMKLSHICTISVQCVLVHACIEGPLDPGRTAQSSVFRTIDPSRVLAVGSDQFTVAQTKAGAKKAHLVLDLRYASTSPGDR